MTPGGQVPTVPATVEYDYIDGTGGTGGQSLYAPRLGDLVYFQTRKIEYNYGSDNTTDPDYVDYLMSRLGSIIDDDGTTLASYQYIGADSMVGEDYNQPNVSLDYTARDYSGFDPFGRIAEQLWDNSSGNTIDGYYYYWLNSAGTSPSDTLGRTVNVTNDGLDSTYGYYSTGRLQYEQDTSTGLSTDANQFDAAGNQIETWDACTQNFVQNLAVNAANELFTVNLAGRQTLPTMQYDAAGNMTSLTDPTLASPSSGVAKTCTWDAWGRLASVAEPNSRGGTTTFAYSYDGAGRLVATSTTVAGPRGWGRVTASADNYYAGSQLIETDVSDGTVYQYVWSARAADPILRDTIAGPDSGDRYYYLSDANGNVTAVTDTGGNVLERYSYDADGNVTVCDRYWNPVTDNVSQYGTTILFAGCQLDTNTGLYLIGARWYDPGLNRFISRDPLGYLGSPVNLYTYCGDNPVGSTDPSGLSCELGTYYTPNSSSSGYVDCSELVVETEGNPGGGGGLAGAGRGSAADFSKYGADAPGDSAGDLVSILVGRGNNSSGGYVLTANEADGGNSSDGGGVLVFDEENGESSADPKYDPAAGAALGGYESDVYAPNADAKKAALMGLGAVCHSGHPWPSPEHHQPNPRLAERAGGLRCMHLQLPQPLISEAALGGEP